MLYTPLTKKAMRICFDAHKDQVDKSGLPYVFHPFHLAEQMDTEEAVCTALLHDVVEDTNMTLADLAKEGFPETVLHALQRLTHNPSMPYFEYIHAIAKDPLAVQVKRADLLHNSCPGRLDHPTQDDLFRIQKYQMALAILSGQEA